MKKRVLSSLLAFVMLVTSAFVTRNTAAFAEDMGFSDVKSGSWYYNSVKYVYERNIMTGLSDGLFGPGSTITRGMVVNVLWRMSGDAAPAVSGNVFPDVPAGKWYTKAVAWAKESGVVSGYKNGDFGPADDITRQDFCIILNNYSKYKNAKLSAETSESYQSMSDAKDVSGYAKSSMEWAFQRGFIGKGGSLKPKGQLTRAETAAMIQRFDGMMRAAKPTLVKQGNVYDEEEAAERGYNLTFELYSDDTLCLSGNGALEPNYGMWMGPLSFPNFWPDEEVPVIRKVVINKGITAIEHNFFQGLEYLESVVIPDTVTRIGAYAFLGCKKLKSITVPDSVEYIGAGAFSDCSGLEQIDLPEHELEIAIYDDSPMMEDRYPFFNTAYYANASNWDGDVLYIGKHLVNAKGTISGSCTVREGTADIANGAFENCKGLTGVTIPDGVWIGERAFNGCEALSAITLPEDLPQIGFKAFHDTQYYNDMSNWDGGVLYIGKNLYDVSLDFEGGLRIKDGTLGIADCALCTQWYEKNEKLTSVYVPDSVRYIGRYAFRNCPGLTDIRLPEGITEIRTEAFAGTGIKYVFMKSFAENQEIVEPDLIRPWELYDGVLLIPGSVERIGEYAFRECNELIDVNLRDGFYSLTGTVRVIEDHAFYCCGKMRSFGIGDGLTSIGKHILYGCNELNGVYGFTPESLRMLSELELPENAMVLGGGWG